MSLRKILYFFSVCLAILAVGVFVAKSDALLFWAIRQNSEPLARFSLTVGSSPNAKERSSTVLMEATERGETHVVEALLARGAAVQAIDEDQRQALHHAARNGQVDGAIVGLLLARGASPLTPSRDGVTPLMEAVSGLSGGTLMNAIAMISYATDVNQQDREGNTALLIATTEANTEVLRSLLRAGANPNIANHKGGLPITAAASNGLADRVQILLAFGADPFLRRAGSPSASDIVNGKAPNLELELRFREVARMIESTASTSRHGQQRTP